MEVVLIKNSITLYQPMCSASKANNSIRSIDLRNNGIGDEGAKAIGLALQVNKTLQRLSLRRNNIGADGAKAIGKALEENKTVIELRMGANKMGPAGAEAIANMLKVNKSITHLHLNLNNIGPDGAAAIGKALEVTEALQGLNLIDNNIGPEGAKAIADMLKVNTSLLVLYNNKIGDPLNYFPQAAQARPNSTGQMPYRYKLEALRAADRLLHKSSPAFAGAPHKHNYSAPKVLVILGVILGAVAALYLRPVSVALATLVAIFCGWLAMTLLSKPQASQAQNYFLQAAQALSLVADSKQASSAATSLATRVQDLDLASMGLLPPIHGVMDQPLPGEQPGQLGLLRRKGGTAVKPWFKYLRLLFSAIGKLPAVTENVWRGVSLPDEAEAKRQIQLYKDEGTLFWWGASSCTVDMDTSVQFTGGKDAPYTRIMFQVRCRRGARIETLSAITNEKEVLLLPGSSFKVKNVAEVATKLWIVELEEEILPANIKPIS
eukprot:g76882.t1